MSTYHNGKRVMSGFQAGSREQVMVEDNDTREGNFGKRERVQIYRG